MNKIDILLLVILAFGAVRGFMRGVIIEMASLLAIVIGIYGAIHFSFFTASLLDKILPAEKQTLEIFAFGITLIVLMLGVMLLAKVLTQMLKIAELGLSRSLVWLTQSGCNCRVDVLVFRAYLSNRKVALSLRFE